MSRMNVVSSPSLITSPICFDYQATSPLPLTLPRSEVMYLKTTFNSLTVPRAGCHSSFAGLTTETPMNRMSVIQVRNRIIVPYFFIAFYSSMVFYTNLPQERSFFKSILRHHAIRHPCYHLYSLSGAIRCCKLKDKKCSMIHHKRIEEIIYEKILYFLSQLLVC